MPRKGHWVKPRIKHEWIFYDEVEESVDDIELSIERHRCKHCHQIIGSPESGDEMAVRCAEMRRQNEEVF